MNLLRAEWSRLFARRFTTIMILVVIAILSLVAVGVALSSQKPGPQTAAQATQLADRERANMVAMRQQCEEAKRNPGEVPPEARGAFPPGMDCAQAFDPSRIRDEDFLPHVFVFRNEGPQLILVFGGVFTLLAFAIGASFVGAEWSSGSMMNLLTWRPKRLTVLATKLVALLSGLTAIGAVLAAAWVGVLWGIAAWRGRTGPITNGLLTSLALTNGRAIALALVAAAAGFALASVGRHTAMALGVAIGYGLILEIGLRTVLQIAEVTKTDRWFVSTYAAAWLNKKVEFEDWTSCRFSTGDCQPVKWSLDMADSAIVLGSGVAILLLIAFAVMRRRDVT